MADLPGVQIQEITDLEDRIDVLESIIEDLQRPKLSKGELEVVRPIQLINQYVILEDSINLGIEHLSRTIKSVQDKKQLDSNTDRFNKVNSDFQENWNDEYWKYYEMVKDGSIHKRSGFKPELSVRVAHLQELATILDKNINDEKKPESEKAKIFS